MLARTAVTIFALAAVPVASAPLLEQPIDCVLGETCYIQNYVDADPSPNWSDFACGTLSYDGHKGTDFALLTLQDMERGVDVLAAASGVVVGTRDGMADIAITAATAADVEGRECGNGVAIDHGEGWITQYCHMKRGSIVVAKGDTILAKEPVGQVGLSGKTEFPHLHISIRQHGRVVDPFAPSDTGTRCDPLREDALWADTIGYVAGGLVRLGFETGVPSYDNVKSGAAGAALLAPDAPAFVLFAQGFGSRKGDVIHLQITGPDGFAFDHETTLDKPQALYFRAAGKKKPQGGWVAGHYTGTVTLMRDGMVYDRRDHAVTVR